jgi:hypothetical protein
MEALAELYTATGQYDDALRIYLSQVSASATITLEWFAFIYIYIFFA